MAELGFLGLGTMGSAMARRLVDAGHTVRVWNRSPEAATSSWPPAPMPRATPADALAQPVSFSMLANDEAADAVFDRRRARGRRGRVHVNMASISPDGRGPRSPRVTARPGSAMSPRPVLGRPTGRRGGQAQHHGRRATPPTSTRVEPYLDVLGARTWRVGDRAAHGERRQDRRELQHHPRASRRSASRSRWSRRHGVDAPAVRRTADAARCSAASSYTGYGDIIADRRYTPAGFTVARPQGSRPRRGGRRRGAA